MTEQFSAISTLFARQRSASLATSALPQAPVLTARRSPRVRRWRLARA
jgi:hypothetical protein